MKFFKSLLVAILLAVFLSPAIAGVFDVGVAPVFCSLIGLSVVQGFITIPGVALFAVQKEIWVKDIIEDLFSDNAFLNFLFNADEYVLQGKVVHIPQSGGSGNVVKNRTELPATVRKRSDTDVTYAIDEFTTDPVLLPNADTVELSYDKRRSLWEEDRAKLVETAAEELLYTLANGIDASRVIPTTGADTPATAPGATGNRKTFIRADLQKAQVLLNKDNVPKKDRYALLSSELQAQLFPPNDAVTATYMQVVSEEERKQGVIAKLHGFSILDRSSVLRYASDGTLKVPEAAGSTTDNEGVICWQKNAFERAMGDVLMYEDMGNPQFYGDIYSFLLRLGGRRRRADHKGVVVIRQAS